MGGDKEDEVPEFEVDSHAQGIAADVVKEVAAEVVVSQSAEDEWEWVEVEEDDENAGLPYSWERAPGQTCVTRSSANDHMLRVGNAKRGACGEELHISQPVIWWQWQFAPSRAVNSFGNVS